MVYSPTANQDAQHNGLQSNSQSGRTTQWSTVQQPITCCPASPDLCPRCVRSGTPPYPDAQFLMSLDLDVLPDSLMTLVALRVHDLRLSQSIRRSSLLELTSHLTAASCDISEAAENH
ncbi:hypothetical protein NQD34_005794 [Periophthalmus magnuspinnatus]|nr:hypothetical protein NQD34_005794 [Periophthalmus magnuspinnatus]